MMSGKIRYQNSGTKRFTFLFVLLPAVFHLLSVSPLHAETKLTLLLTSNLQGRFSKEKENQDETDPMLILARSILKEKEKSRFDFYLDLGNAFYPGAISRYSYGSVMMDFFSFFNCEATLISSRDISLGLSNLEFLSRGKAVKMLSANITRDNKPVFTPYIILKHSGKKIGIIGVSSSQGLIDIADKKVLNISFSEYRESIKDKALLLKREGCDNLILLSGLSYKNNLELMQDIPEVNLIISGGDSAGSIFSIPASRVDLQWGRSIVTLAEHDGYYKIELGLSEGINVASMNFVKPEKYKTSEPAYEEFSSRLSLWKEKFKNEETHLIAENIPECFVKDETVANMLRHRYRSEIGIVEKDSILPQTLAGKLYYSDIMSLISNDYPIFTYRLSGADLKIIEAGGSDLVITGIEKSRVQNYPVSDGRTYSICSTQIAYDKVVKLLRKHIDYKNTWKNLQDEIEDDLKKERSLTSADFNYLDNRFRMLLDISLSNFYDRSVVEKGENIDSPPGKPDKTYHRWGMENTVNLTLYNKYNHLVLTPYIYYIKQNEEYQQNLLRGTLVYTFNPNSIVMPYHKSQVDTVLVKVDQRPILARETVGASLNSERITGKLGAGFEKQIQYPDNPRLYGIETLLDANYPFTDELVYTLKLDSFISQNSRNSNELKARTEITNALTYNINTLLGVSVKYKWFYLYSRELGESYKYSQTLISINLKTDFKLF